jgi:hypothetical protein
MAIKLSDPVTCALTFANITQMLTAHTFVQKLAAGTYPQLACLDLALTEASASVSAGTGDATTVYVAEGADALGSYVQAGFGSGVKLGRASIPTGTTPDDRVAALRRLEAHLVDLLADVRKTIMEQF